MKRILKKSLKISISVFTISVLTTIMFYYILRKNFSLRLQYYTLFYKYLITKHKVICPPQAYQDNENYNYIKLNDIHYQILITKLYMPDKIPKDEYQKLSLFYTKLSQLFRIFSQLVNPNIDSLVKCLKNPANNSFYVVDSKEDYKTLLNTLDPPVEIGLDITCKPDSLFDGMYEEINLGKLLTELPWCYCLEAVEGDTKITHKVDLRYMKKYNAYKSLFNPHCYVELQQIGTKLNVKSIECMDLTSYATETSSRIYYPSENKLYQKACKIVICAIINHLTIVQHFSYTHIAISNTVCIETRNKLKYNHPLRPLLQPYIYGTINTNLTMGISLMMKNGTMESVSCFPMSEIYKICDEFAVKLDITDLNPEYEIFTLRKLCEIKYIKKCNRKFEEKHISLSQNALDTLMIYDIFEEHIMNYFDVLYKYDDPKKRITNDSQLMKWLDSLINSPMFKNRLGSKFNILYTYVKQNTFDLYQYNSFTNILIQFIATLLYTMSVRHDLLTTKFIPYLKHATKVMPQISRYTFKLSKDTYLHIIGTIIVASLETKTLIDDYQYVIPEELDNSKKLKNVFYNTTKKFRNFQKIKSSNLIESYLEILPANIGISSNT